MATINLKYYKDKDINCYYVLNELTEDKIELLKDPSKDEEVKEKFPELYYYLLSKGNEYLLNWHDFKENSNILEISPGLGANTKTLCKKAKNVTTVNFSKINAEIIKERLKEFDNLEIIAGKIDDIEFNQKFDYIVLVDVFEVFNLFFRTPVEMLQHLKQLLNEGGSIIYAVSNKYGFGDFSGRVSHITGHALDSINNYPKTPALNMFTKRQLYNISRLSGFKNVDFYYPIPNHYVNGVLLSDNSLENAMVGNKIADRFLNYDVNPNNLINEKMLVDDFMQTDFTFFVNSYLMFLSDDNSPKTNYAQVHRGILTTLDDNCCKKIPLTEEAVKVLDNMFDFYNSETKRLKENNIENIKYALCKKLDKGLTFELAKGIPMNRIALSSLFNHNQLLAILMEYKELIYKLYPNRTYNDYKIQDIVLENVALVENANIDLNMANIFKEEDNYTIIDYDKTTDVIPLNYIVAQGLFVLAIDSNFNFREVEYLKLLGLSEREIAIYQAIYAKNVRN